MALLGFNLEMLSQQQSLVFSLLLYFLAPFIADTFYHRFCWFILCIFNFHDYHNYSRGERHWESNLINQLIYHENWPFCFHSHHLEKVVIFRVNLNLVSLEICFDIFVRVQ